MAWRLRGDACGREAARRHPWAHTAWGVGAWQATRLRRFDPLAQRRVAFIDEIGVPGWGEAEAEAEAEAWAEAEVEGESWREGEVGA